jgi:3-dehydroquinate synthase
VNPALSFRFGDYTSDIHFVSSMQRFRFSADSGIVLVFDRNTAGIKALTGIPVFTGESSRDDSASAAAAPRTVRVILKPGERSKSWSGASRILGKALEAGLGRDGSIVGIGGGMICDLAAFAASLYMRGCRLLLVPTSLLAMVDAAIGGKTAINYGGYKNMAGTFYPAEQIVIDVSLLKSLPAREFRSGLGEVIKTALLGDRALLTVLSSQKERIMDRDPALMEETVRRCIAVKAGIVEADLRESGKRVFLNLGHTFAHALEAATGYRLWSHGQAVAWGVMQAAFLSEHLGMVDSSYTGRIRDLVRMYGFDLQVQLKPESIVKAMLVDKKKRRGKLRLVLQRGIGDTMVKEVDSRLVAETLRRSSRNLS